MPDLEKQHDELRAAVSRAREAWWRGLEQSAAAQSQERNAYARLQESQRRLNEFDKRNEVLREDD